MEVAHPKSIDLRRKNLIDSAIVISSHALILPMILVQRVQLDALINVLAIDIRMSMDCAHVLCVHAHAVSLLDLKLHSKFKYDCRLT